MSKCKYGIDHAQQSCYFCLQDAFQKLKAENEELKKHIEFIETDNAVYAAKVDGSWPNEQIVKLKAENEELIKAVKMAYRKHHLSDMSLGWEELSDALCDALCNVLGDDGFQKWVESEAKK